MDRSRATLFLTTTYRSLARQQDLSPNNPAINRSLRALVATLQSWQAAGFGAELVEEPCLAEVSRGLPELCAAAECAMEKWWSRRVLESPCPAAQVLEAFWYLENYRELCAAEHELVGHGCGGRFAFLGSGALPMTALILAKADPLLEMRCIDCDGEACELAERITRRLGLAERITIWESRAEHFAPREGETVICASLLRAPGLFAALLRGGVKRLLVRDAEGVYRFCYRRAELPGAGFIERGRARPSPKRINTSRYFEAIAPDLDLAGPVTK
jgi:Nicotianamine synthase protein